MITGYACPWRQLEQLQLAGVAVDSEAVSVG